MKKYLLLAGLALLSACASDKTAEIDPPLLSGPFMPIDPDDAKVVIAVKSFLENSGGPVSSTYKFQRVDLNNDGRRDALVLFKTPYGYWCDRHGCTMLVLQASDDNFTLVNAVQPIREPVYVNDIESHGWRNIVLRVSGRWDKAKDVALQYDGQSYPDNPDNLPAYLHLAARQDTRLFYYD